MLGFVTLGWECAYNRHPPVDLAQTVTVHSGRIQRGRLYLTYILERVSQALVQQFN